MNSFCKKPIRSRLPIKFGLLLAALAAIAPADGRTDDLASIGEKDVDCLALNIYHESRNQPWEGQLAIAHVTLNRWAEARMPMSLCDVIYRGRHFSWIADPRRADKLPSDVTAWERARRVAREAIADRAVDPVNGSTYFRAVSVAPEWASLMKRGRQIGAHVIYSRRGTRTRAGSQR